MPRPTFTPTEEQRRQVKTLAAMGNSHDSIGKVIGIAAKTLRKHFDQELFRGVIDANTQVAGKLFQSAMGGSVAAQKYWLAVRAGWREKAPEGQRGPVVISDFVVRGPARKPDSAGERDDLDKAA
jgi:hypothetical protein